jgi:O-antigen ligase
MTAANPSFSHKAWRSLPVAEGFAAAVAAALPWSTSATGILIALWLVASLPRLDAAALRREALSAPGGLPVLLGLLGIAGLLWADVSATERLRGVEPFLRLLLIPVLMAQFHRSDRGLFVGAAFLVSATALLAVSLMMVALAIQTGHGPGVPVKDYVSQSGMFVLCGFALIDVAARRIARQPVTALACAALAIVFLADIAYVSTSRTTLVVIPVLYVLWGFYRLSGRTLAAHLALGVVLAAGVWLAAPEVRARLMQIPAEIETHQATGANTSSGARLEFWKGSLAALDEAPLFGHGTGTIAATLRRHGEAEGGVAATNPHNQLLAVGLQLGAAGMAVLLAMWAAHLMRFMAPAPAAWFGLIAVVQNIVGSLFNSHLMDFTQGWLYVFAVGVFGGMVRDEAAAATHVAPALANDRATTHRCATAAPERAPRAGEQGMPR